MECSGEEDLDVTAAWCGIHAATSNRRAREQRWVQRTESRRSLLSREFTNVSDVMMSGSMPRGPSVTIILCTVAFVLYLM